MNQSRAVLREIGPGNTMRCCTCDQWVIYRSKKKQRRIIANVYEGGKWVRVEHFHEDCYAGQYGPPDTSKIRAFSHETRKKEQPA